MKHYGGIKQFLFLPNLSSFSSSPFNVNLVSEQRSKVQTLPPSFISYFN